MEGVEMVWVGQEKAHCGERWEPKLSLSQATQLFSTIKGVFPGEIESHFVPH